jgi:hypothetical protein
MGFIERMVVKIIGKKVDAQLDKWHISKEKITWVVGGAMAAYNYMAPLFQWPPVPEEVMAMLAAFGLWSMRDRAASEKAEKP